MFKKEHIFNHFGLTLQEGHEKTPFFKVCHNSEDFSYCVFGSDKIVNLINENVPNNSNKKVLIDGTFSIVPLGCFKQLILIHIEYYEKVRHSQERGGGARRDASGVRAQPAAPPAAPLSCVFNDEIVK